MYIYIYIYIHICVYIYIYTHTHTCIHLLGRVDLLRLPLGAGLLGRPEAGR